MGMCIVDICHFSLCLFKLFMHFSDLLCNQPPVLSILETYRCLLTASLWRALNLSCHVSDQCDRLSMSSWSTCWSACSWICLKTLVSSANMWAIEWVTYGRWLMKITCLQINERGHYVNAGWQGLTCIHVLEQLLKCCLQCYIYIQ